jgi:hypothetical protein
MSNTPHGKPRSWPIRIIALLLLLQAVGLVGLGVYYISTQPDLERNLNLLEATPEQGFDKLSPEVEAVLEAVISGIFLVPLAIPALVAAIGFLFLFRFGWILAMITQTVALLVCLMLYLDFKPVIVYPIMVYCTLMVLYLNVAEVRLAFFVGRAERKHGRGDDYEH